MSLKVFISSTYIDLIDYRRVAIEVVNRYKCVPLAMEFFGSQPQDPTTVAGKEVRECDIFVGIYAHRFGFVPGGQEKSITQQEYELAKAQGKDCLCFVVKKDHPWNPQFCEYQKYEPLQVFLKTVLADNTVSFFTTAADLEGKLSSSLGKLLLDKQGGDGRQGRRVKLISIAPTPCIAHPYPLPPNFTGREAEKARLSHWLLNAAEPLLVMEAIGGMGKSALSWVWLHREVLEKPSELDGVFWWSFYEEPFESFLAHLYHYITSKEVKVDRGALFSDISALHSVLHHNRFLLILDGFERALRGYYSLNAMYRQETALSAGESETEWDKRQREPVHPQARHFLQRLSSGKSKTLLTTRLFPAPLEELSGVQHFPLTGLSRADAVRFFRNEGISGSRAEMERAGEIYHFHPLMLKLLGSAIKRSREKDIKAAFTLKLINQKEPQKILSTGFSLLNKQEQQVVTTIAVFRGTFDFNAAQTLFPKMNENALWQLLSELRQLGFLFYSEREDCFDFHPILRSFLYDHLTAPDAVHERAVQYFRALPAAEKVVTVEDLTPVIELYHHLVSAGKYDEARELYRDRLSNPIYFQLSNYNLEVELLKALFPEGEERPPRLKKEGDQAWTLNSLANSYSLSGQPGKAAPLFLRNAKYDDENNRKSHLAIGLGNVASMAQIYLGQLSAAAGHLQKHIALCREIGEEFYEAVGRQEWGRALAYQGRWQGAEKELAASNAYWEKTNDVQGLSLDYAYRALSLLLQARLAQALPGQAKNAPARSREALQQAGQALGFAEKTAQTRHPVPRDFVQAYYLLGEALLLCRQTGAANQVKPPEIRFYDEPFQQVQETLLVKPGEELAAAERCLSEALRRCRKVNMVDFEPGILLGWAKLEEVKSKKEEVKRKKENIGKTWWNMCGKRGKLRSGRDTGW